MTLQHVDGGVTVGLEGELDIAATDVLSAELRMLTYRYDRDQLTFDCAQLRFLDVTGLCALIAATRRMAGGLPVLARPSPMVRRLLSLTGLDACFDVVDDLDEVAAPSTWPACARTPGPSTSSSRAAKDRPFVPTPPAGWARAAHHR